VAPCEFVCSSAAGGGIPSGSQTISVDIRKNAGELAHTTLGRYFDRPDVKAQLRQVRQQLRAEQRALAGARAAERRLEQEGSQLVHGDRDQNGLFRPPGRSSHVAVPVGRVMGWLIRLVRFRRNGL
jgi:hypothetical protein